MHQACSMRPVTQSVPPAFFQQQQRLAHLPRVHAPTKRPLQEHLGSYVALSALQDLEIKPFAPVQQSHTTLQDIGHEFHIPPVADWANDEFLMSGCEAGSSPLRVAVLVSGGVDSSLALQLVTAAGHKATAFYLQIWFQEDFRNFWDSCPWEEDLDYAKKVCSALNVPLVVVPLTQQYWDRVVAHSVAEIKAGRTPNPDMLCNSRVKFGAFVEYLESQHGASFDRIASGHYARIMTQQQYQHQQQHNLLQQRQQQQATTSASQLPASEEQLADRLSSHGQASSSSSDNSSNCSSSSSRSSHSVHLLDDSARYLSLTPDAVKDQTYFLANLSSAQLSKCMFPLGGFTKPQVRALATAAGLATSGRKDSQGICFLGKVKFNEFVKEHLGEWPGPLVEEDSGEVVGVHSGYWFYTVGQRGGIKLPGGPWYVTAKDMTRNIVYISKSYYEADKRRDAFICGPFNWLSQLRPQPDRPLFVKVRHGPNMMQCRLLVGQQQNMMQRLTSSAATPSSSSVAAAAASEKQSSSSATKGIIDLNGVLAQQQPEHQQQQQQQQMKQQISHDSVATSPSVTVQDDGLYGMVDLSENDQGLAAGQYAVFYQDGICLGSAQMLGTVAQ